MRKHIARPALAAALGGALLLTACSGAAPDPQGAAFEPTDTIRATIDIPATFNPAVGMSLPDFVLARMSFDTLVRKDDTGVVPGLAASWEATPNSATFTLREGASCSDGTPITPTIVKNSLDAFAQSGGTIVPQTFGSQTPTITADDAANTVTIDLEQPWAYLLQGLTSATTGIVCPAGLADPEGLAAGSVEGAESGPYVQTAAEPGVRYRYELREDYELWPEWSSEIAGEPAKKLEFVVSPDTSATSNLVLDGQLDIAKIMPESMDRFEGQSGYEVAKFLFSDFTLIFNEREGSPFTDPELRKAVAQVIDRDEFNTVAMQGLGEVGTTLSNSSAQCVTGEDLGIVPSDPAAAAKVLDGVKIRLVAPLVVGTNGAGNVYLQEALRAAGADVTLDNVDVGTWISTVYTQPGDWDLTVFADLNTLGTLASPVGMYIGPGILEGGANVGGGQPEGVEALYTEARATQDEDARCALLQEAAEKIVAGSHGTPLITDTYLYAQRPGFRVSMLGGSLDDHIFRITGE
ncbi:ABC transporter substrate-binding protein [Leucobacter massiliensis]|uniref:Peptide ABC transporter substrate-binding protein n=1 Tax=Leucobacter massiliensis TaxID=1686285 RepID=A0A2S9QSX2_9MICO|nr:ABC transporter substrate-binding protein [Leucobacter massiliensis]PRI12669.1 peptide ABC transporter substrate-binding protein [Leucobacter massiliensis]